MLEAGCGGVPEPRRRSGEHGHVEVTCGWAEFLDPLRRDVVARSRVSVQDPPRGYNPLRRRRRLIWLLRFEGGAQDCWLSCGR